VRVGLAIGRAIKLRQRQRGAQFEAARFLRLRDRDRGLQRPLGRRGIDRIALQQHPGADAVHFRLVPMLFDALRFGQRIFKALDPDTDLARTRFGFGQGRFETGQVQNKALLPIDGEAASHLGEPRFFGTVGPLCPALRKYGEAGPPGWEIVSKHDIGERLAIACDRFRLAPNKPQPCRD